MFGMAAAVGVATALHVVALQPPATSAEPDAPELVSGQVTETVGGGSEAVEGAPVTVWWVPGVESAKVGDRLPIETLATVTTDANGSYEIDVEPTAAMQRAARANDGWVNFDISVADADLGRLESSIVTRRLVGDDWQTPAEASPSPAAARTAKVSAQSQRAARRLGEVPSTDSASTDLVISASSEKVDLAAPARRGVAGRSTAAEAAAAEAPVYALCSFEVQAKPERYVNIIELHNATNSRLTWRYGKKADSDIDAAMDYSGDGGWQIRGNGHIGNSHGDFVDGVIPAGQRINQYAITKFEFVEGQYKPYGLGRLCKDTSIPVNSKSKKAVKWLTGADERPGAGAEYVGCDQAPQSAHRARYGVGNSYTRDTENASKIGFGVDVGPINLGSQSGFSENVTLHWTAVKGPIWLCGTNQGIRYAGVIHAQNKP
ncbi:hypothetical protein ACIRN4_27040 [Pimelobacter simplex]|uniref:hypothetical protein n=1 Tax=Nocardioides simplex TaxID=2045 RepID=UPI0038164698